MQHAVDQFKPCLVLSSTHAVAVTEGRARNGAAIIRPPGHHAESGTAMGFCYFNNVAVAARAAQKVGGLFRVQVVD